MGILKKEEAKMTNLPYNNDWKDAIAEEIGEEIIPLLESLEQNNKKHGRAEVWGQ